MGSSFKINGNNQRGSKPYALMLLLAFGAAILGVMVLHKLREKRIFSVLVKEKDHELLTLHLLYQREKEFNQEARKKIEEMKNKVYFLRTQKLELDRRLSEMESTLSSLKDERNVIESTLEEKKNKIQTLTAGTNTSSVDPIQLNVLKDIIKMKDGEIEHLKGKPEDVHSKKTELITSSTSSDGDLQLSSDSFSDQTMDEKISQNDNNIQGVYEQVSDAEPGKLVDVKDGVDLKREIAEKEVKETADYQADRDPKVTEIAKVTSTSNEDEQQKSQENRATDGSKYTNNHRGGQKLEKPDESVSGIGSRVRRKHSKGKRRETLRNRRSGDGLHYVSKTESTPALTSDDKQQKYDINKAQQTEFEVKNELNHNDLLPLFDNLNNTTDTRKFPGNGSQPLEEAEKKGEQQVQKSTEIKYNGTEETEQVNHGSLVSIEQNEFGIESDETKGAQENDGKQISDEINQSRDQDGNSKQEKMHNIEEKKHENDNDQGNEIVIEEGDAEDSEDAETNEPEIDRDDIRRFSESDPDEEAEETEF